MSSASPPEGSEFSEPDSSHYSYYGSEVSEKSTLAELLERFTIDAKPECTLKLRSQAGPLVLGADLTHVVGTKANVGALVIKPSGTDQPWRRLRVDNSGTLTLRSRKLHWWLFTLDVTGHANPFSRTFDLSYRVATKWDVTRGEYRNKRRMELGEQAEARAHWSISYSLPAIEGSMGTAAKRSMSREVHADVGYAHLDIPRVELVVWPWGRPSKQAAAAAADAFVDDDGDEGAAAAAAGGSSRGSGMGAEPAATWEGAEMQSSSVVGEAATAAADASSAQQQQLRERDAGAHPQGGNSGGSGSGQRRRAGLQQLNSHVASISGRWWDVYSESNGSKDGSGSGTLERWNRR